MMNCPRTSRLSSVRRLSTSVVPRSTVRPDGRMTVVRQQLATTRLADGTEIAYAVAGSGPLLVHAPGWLTHLELSWAMPPERGFYEALARGRTLVRYDRPGCGLSGPTTETPSMDLEVRTLEAVVAAVTSSTGTTAVELFGAS